MKSRLLLICGILSSLYYIGINIYVPTAYDGYSMVTYTVSELSAIGAPTRQLWVYLVIVYILLFAAFGWGILRVAAGNRALRIVGFVILAYSVFNVFWPPMHQRGIEPSLTDALHIVWSFVTVSLMLVMMGFGATAFGKAFQRFSIVSIILLIGFGVLTGLEAPNIPTNQPTPLIGLWERINIGIFMIWVIVFALVLLQTATVQVLTNADQSGDSKVSGGFA